ncbi:MAG: DUF924 domain-containing protein [Burkholderiaceae bacterium]|nr:DUF924 domain-containing protein [Burkholderiaceae bacterium]
MTTPQDVLDFWFGAPGSPDYGRARTLWFEKSQVTDDAIRAHFGAAVEAALQGAYGDWRKTPRGALALILMLDQFTRNVFRDTPRAFAGDARALATAQALVECGDDRSLTPYERQFAYLPFEHSEDRAAQETSLRLFTQLARDGVPEALEWARKHYDVIARFGRYPHRNAILGRESTPEELEFLQQPGSRF